MTQPTLIEGALSPGGDPQLLHLRDGRLTAITAPGPTPDHRAELVTIGLIDAHIHPVGVGARQVELDLSGVRSLAQVRAAVRDWPGSGWIVGRGWDHTLWTDHDGLPTRQHLDAVCPHRPVALRRIDGHALWVNSAALPPLSDVDPPGGRVLRDPHGQPTGLLIDAAMDTVRVPSPSGPELRRRLLLAQDELLGLGVTGVHDMEVDDALLDAWEQLDRSGRLRLDVVAYLSPGSEAARRLLSAGPWRGRRLDVRGIKLFADGALGSRGALLTADYTDAPGIRGLSLRSSADIAALTAQALRVGAQVATHAIGDQAVSSALDAYEAARAHSPGGGSLRLEHAQIVRPEDLHRFARLGVVASVQPAHRLSDQAWVGERLGPDRLSWAYRLRSLERAGALLAFGSDAPVEPADPARALGAASPRDDADPRFISDESIAPLRALQAHTRGPRLAIGRSAELQVGASVDLSLWERASAGGWRGLGAVVDGVFVGSTPSSGVSSGRASGAAPAR